jgi:hypothetical protein
VVHEDVVSHLPDPAGLVQHVVVEEPRRKRRGIYAAFRVVLEVVLRRGKVGDHNVFELHGRRGWWRRRRWRRLRSSGIALAAACEHRDRRRQAKDSIDLHGGVYVD